MTIAERLTRTTSRTARQMLQDEAAIHGAMYNVPRSLEDRLLHAEYRDFHLHADTYVREEHA